MAIYLDNSAAALMQKGVKSAMVKGVELFGNPSSFNDAGHKAKEALKEARKIVALSLGAKPNEIVFTGSGSESNNLAIFGVGESYKKGEIITTPIEHPSVRLPIAKLREQGFLIKEAPVDSEGLISPNDFSKLLSKKTVLVSIMYANNEIGSIEPVVAIGKIIKKLRQDYGSKSPLFHVDACQAWGYLNCNVNELGVDLLTVNGSKIGGPKGVGILYIRQGTKITPQILGGEQEQGFRAGTENISAIIGLSQAAKSLNQKEESKRLRILQEMFIAGINSTLPKAKINGPKGEKRLPNNVHISIPGATSENLLLELDKYGIMAGSGSACTSYSVEPSHVLKAIGVEKEYLAGAIRFSMGKETKKSEVEYVLKILPKVVSDLKKRYSKEVLSGKV